MADARDNERAGYGFTRQDHKRVSDVVRQAEGSARGGTPSGGQGNLGRRPRAAGFGGGRFAYCPSGIAAATGTAPSLTPGSASLAMYDFDGTSFVLAETATVYNMTKTAVGSTRMIQVSLCGGFYFVDVEDC